ncbi:acyl-CoA dehydrogenase family protein [Streptomyces sp. NPDC001970]
MSTSAPTAEDLKSAAARMAPGLVERQAQAESDRRLTDETVAELAEAGFVHTQLPPHLGGGGIDMLSEMEISAALAHGCTSTAWVRSVLSGATGLLALLPEQGIEEVFGGSTRLPVACGVNSLGGQAQRVDSGYLVTGSWGFASGCLHADQAILAVRIDGDDDGPKTGAACLPMTALTIKDTWYVAGLTATGSNTLVADTVFLPDHLMLPEPPGATAILHRSPPAHLPQDPPRRRYELLVAAAVFPEPFNDLREDMGDLQGAGVGVVGIRD